MSALAELYECHIYSDLTLVCGNKKYSVHRAIVCSRSEFFEGACRNQFRDSEPVVDLNGNDPKIVEYMINYLYHLDYLTQPISRHSSQTSQSLTSPRSPRSPRSPLRRKSKKLNLQICEDLLVAIPRAGQNMKDPNEGRIMKSDAAYVEKPNLITHVKMYAIAVKYGIVCLKWLARSKFAHQIKRNVNNDELVKAFREVYETTVDTDRGLRDIVILTFRSHPDLSLRDDVKLMSRTTAGVSLELFGIARELPVTILKPTTTAF